jgi:hypothetical protein
MGIFLVMEAGFIRSKTDRFPKRGGMNHNNFSESHGCGKAGDKSFKFLPYQLSMVG